MPVAAMRFRGGKRIPIPLNEKPYLIWEVIKLYLHVFSGRLLLNMYKSDFSPFQKILAIKIIGRKLSRSNRVSH